MIFSILIATINERKEQFDTLKAFLTTQIEQNGLQNEVDIISYPDNRVVPIGIKRTVLVQTSDSDFVAFVDDDDWVADSYVKTIYDTIKANPDIDCIGIRGYLQRDDGMDNRYFIHSIKYDYYGEENNIFVRPPNHLNPIRRTHLIDYKFAPKNIGEDFDFAMNLVKSGRLKKEVYIDDVLYYYRFSWANTKAQEGTIINAIKRRLPPR